MEDIRPTNMALHLKNYPSGMNRFRQKLKQEHLTVTDEQIEEVFGEHRTSEEDQIARLAQKKMGTKSGLDFAEQGKVLRFLLSKGHDYSKSKKILNSLISGEMPEDY
ncbi:MAG: hypothetical protein HOP07_10990 [Bacteriovoracaceae bacterium]|nr:hypothetical protein [Bacteriovoracaceae bacterium]